MAVVAPEARSTPRAGRPSPPARPVRRRRSLSERLTLNVVVGVVAALLAFVLVASLLADRRERTTVAVAGAQIAAGTVITPDLLVSEDVPADTGFTDELVPIDQVESGELVATRTIQPGEPLPASAVGDPGSVTPARVMSIPLEAWQAANGQIEVGDQVDVIVSTRDAGSRYVLTGAAVVDRSSADGRWARRRKPADRPRDLRRGRRGPSARAGGGDRGRNDHGRALDRRPRHRPHQRATGAADDGPVHGRGRAVAAVVVGRASRVHRRPCPRRRPDRRARPAGGARRRAPRAGDRRRHAVADAVVRRRRRARRHPPGRRLRPCRRRRT